MAIVNAGLGSVSDVADGGEAHISDTASAYTDGFLHVFKSGGTTQAAVRYDGTIIGRGTTVDTRVFESSGDSSTRAGRASIVQAAITHAAAQGHPYVFVADEHLNYDASAVTFDSSVKMLREGGRHDAFDVQAYGAAGDGSTDDAAAVQETIDAAEAAGGGIVYFPAGTYQVGTALVVDSSGVTWEGAGSVATSLVADSAIVRLMQGLADDFIMRGLTLDGGGVVTNEVTRFVTMDRLLIEDCVFTDAADDDSTPALQLFTVTDVVIRRNRFHAVDIGFELRKGDCRNVTFENNEVEDYAERGVYVLGSATIRHREVKVESNFIHSHNTSGSVRRPIHVIGNSSNPHEDVRIVGNRVVGNGNSSNAVASPGTADQITATNVLGLIVEGNSSLDGGDNGFALAQENEGVVCNGNLAQRNDATGIQIGSDAGSGTARVVACGNLVLNNGQNREGDRANEDRVGLEIENCTEATVSGNYAGDTQGTPTQVYGILVENSTDVRVSGNEYGNNTTSDFRDEGGNTRLILNGLGEESANAEEPTAADWQPGDIVGFTDSGDASGDGQYLLLQDGSTWAQLA